MNNFKRPFNKKIYDVVDNKTKIATVELMKLKDYELAQPLNKENYKDFDLIFYNKNLDSYLKIEIELRTAFDKIKEIFKTVHIPIRKINSKADYYIIWSNDLNKVGIINMQEVVKTSVVKVVCDGVIDEIEQFSENFIDVPKKIVLFLKKGEETGKWKKY